MTRITSSRSLHCGLRVVGLALTTLIVASTAAGAQLPGTLFGLIEDADGNTVPEATITLTDPDTPSFKQVETSDNKGKYRVFIANATKKYTITITKDGYRPMSLNGVRVTARQRTRRNWTLNKAGAGPAAANPAPAAAGEAPSGNAGALFNRGVAAAQSNDLDSAEQNFKAALEQKPDLHNANAALARLYLERKTWEKALEHATLAKAADHDVDAMNQVLYQSYNELGQKKKAKEILAAMQSADPSKATANMFNEAADLYNQGDSAGAKPKLQELLALDPEHAKANYILGMIFVAEEANEQARTHLEKFIAIAPDDPDAAVAKEILTFLQ